MSRLAPGTAGDKLKSRVPLGRYATVDEIAFAIVEAERESTAAYRRAAAAAGVVDDLRSPPS